MYLSTYFNQLDRHTQYLKVREVQSVIWNILGYDLCKKHDWTLCLFLVPEGGLAHGQLGISRHFLPRTYYIQQVPKDYTARCVILKVPTSCPFLTP